MTRKSLNICALMFAVAGPVLAQSATPSPIYGRLVSAHAQAEQTELAGHGFEEKGDWAAALKQYRAAADGDSIPLAQPFDYLVSSSAHLDVARMLGQLNQADSAEFRSNLQKSRETANKALSFYTLAPGYRAVAYNNLAFAQWMEGDAVAARTAFAAAVDTNAAPAAARDGLKAVDEFVKNNRVLTAPRQKPGGVTDEQWRKVRSVVIDAGMIVFRKKFPVGTSLIGLLLHAVNGQ